MNPNKESSGDDTSAKGQSPSVGTGDGSAFWWALSLAVAYADDESFNLYETVEWSQMHHAAGLSATAANEEINDAVRKHLAAQGWEWSAFTRPAWQYKPNTEVTRGA